MFNYYFGLALRSLRRNVVLTVLMIAAIGVGIGASMTTAHGVPGHGGIRSPRSPRNCSRRKSTTGAPTRRVVAGERSICRSRSATLDAIGLMNAHAAHRQAAMYQRAAADAGQPGAAAVSSRIRATYADFFRMFEVPFRYGGPWGAAEDDGHADVVVITRELNDKVFGGANSVGKTLNLDNHEYRVVGVRSTGSRCRNSTTSTTANMGKREEFFLPFTRAIDGQCSGATTIVPANRRPGWEGHLHSECVWLQFWAELPTRRGCRALPVFLE